MSRASSDGTATPVTDVTISRSTSLAASPALASADRSARSPSAVASVDVAVVGGGRTLI